MLWLALVGTADMEMTLPLRRKGEDEIGGVQSGMAVDQRS